MHADERIELESLHEQVRRLERRTRRLGLWCTLSTALLVTGCLASALRTEDDVVQARAFVVVDADGVPRGVLACSEEAVGLTLQTSDGTSGVQVAVGEEQESILEVGFDLDSGATTSWSSRPLPEGERWPVAGLRVWTDERGRAEVQLSDPEGSVVLGTQSGSAGLSIEAGPHDAWGVLNLGVNQEEGAGFNACWNDETIVRANARKGVAELDLSTESDSIPDEPGHVHLRARLDGGLVELRNAAGTKTFEAP